MRSLQLICKEGLAMSKAKLWRRLSAVALATLFASAFSVSSALADGIYDFMPGSFSASTAYYDFLPAGSTASTTSYGTGYTPTTAGEEYEGETNNPFESSSSSTGGDEYTSMGGYDYEEMMTGPVETHDAVPEPSTVLLFGSGLLGLAAWRRMRKRA